MSARPPIVSRREWGARTTVAGNRGVAWSSRRRFVVHWPVMTTRDERQWCRDIERIHVNAITAAAAPAYNAIVGMSGTIFEGCGLTVRGPANGTNAANIDGISCCVLQPSTAAGVPLAPVSQAARNSVRALYEWCSAQAGRRLTMNGHGQIVATACPGPDLRAWVASGMPASGAPAPSPPPATAEEVELLATALSANGNFHVWTVGPQRRTIWLTHQGANETAWWGGAPGRGPASFRRFADAPAGRTFRSIDAELSRSGNLHLFAGLDDGRTLYTWQRPDESNWPRPLQVFAPAP